MSHRLTISRFAHLAKIDIEFGDLTVFVGAQGAGKSLALQWLKTALDGGEIVRALKDAGQDSRPKTLVDLIFGVGWRRPGVTAFQRLNSIRKQSHPKP